MKHSFLILLGLVLLLPACKKTDCQWPYREDFSPNRCVEIRYDITGIYRGSHSSTTGAVKPSDEYALWAYHSDPKRVTIVPGTIEAFLTGNNTFYITRQTWGGGTQNVLISEGTGFVKDTFMEMKFIYTKVGDSISPPNLFTFRGYKPSAN